MVMRESTDGNRALSAHKRITPSYPRSSPPIGAMTSFPGSGPMTAWFSPLLFMTAAIANGRAVRRSILAKGRPYAHRETIPSFEAIELAAYNHNVEWLRARDRYASLLVSMHRTGLWANRYDAFTSPSGKARERSAAVMAAKKAAGSPTRAREERARRR